MKKIIYTLLLALLPAVGMAQSDISIVFNTPYEGSTITSGVPFNLDFEVVNSGSTTIATGDTIFLAYSIGSQIIEGSAQYLLLTEDLGSGDSSGNLGDPETVLTFSGLEGEAQFCLVVVYGPVDESYSELDTDKVNNTSCRSLFFTGGTSVSVDEEEILANTVYPNPTSDLIHFNTTKASYVQIYDLTGRRLEQFSLEESKAIRLDAFRNGMYIYHLYDEKGGLLKQDKFQVVK